MIAVVTGGNQAVNAFIYGVERNQGTLNFLQQQVQSFSQNVTDIGQQFFARGREIYEQFNGAEAMRLARAALAKVGNILKPDIIWNVPSVAEIQNAGFLMQRFVMAMPELRQLYMDQRIDGYSGLGYAASSAGNGLARSDLYLRLQDQLKHSPSPSGEGVY